MRKSTPIFSRWNNARGFSIIECMIGMCILSIGILAVAAMQTSAVRNTKTGNTLTQALTLARTQMEVLKNSDISDSSSILNPSTLPTTTADANNPMDENGDAGGIYTRTWTVDEYLDADGNASDYARTVTVTVTYPFVSSGTKSVSITSVVTGGGL